MSVLNDLTATLAKEVTKQQEKMLIKLIYGEYKVVSVEEVQSYISEQGYELKHMLDGGIALMKDGVMLRYLITRTEYTAVGGITTGEMRMRIVS